MATLYTLVFINDLWKVDFLVQEDYVMGMETLKFRDRECCYVV